jgi:hypothetical protein
MLRTENQERRTDFLSRREACRISPLEIVRQTGRLLRLWRAGLMILASVLLLLTPSEASKRSNSGEGLSVDLDTPYDKVLKVVQEIADDGIIRGTWQYRGTTELEGATSARTARGFEEWKGGGTVLYKVRPDTLSPEHFHESMSKGTVVVRYIVQPAGPNVTSLRIDAVYEEDDRRRSHASDGQVESSEFAAITAKIKELDDQEAASREQAARQQQAQKMEELEAELGQENAQLETLTAKEKELQKQLQRPPGSGSARVRTASADLKAEPYNQSRTLQLLAQGETVTVLLRTPNWHRVQASNGEEGWVYRLMLEVAP